MIDEIGESCEDERTLNECCISCKIGLMTSSEKCSQLVNFLPSKEAQNSFMECCTGEEDPRQTKKLCRSGNVQPSVFFNARIDDFSDLYSMKSFEGCRGLFSTGAMGALAPQILKIMLSTTCNL